MAAAPVSLRSGPRLAGRHPSARHQAVCAQLSADLKVMKTVDLSDFVPEFGAVSFHGTFRASICSSSQSDAATDAWLSWKPVQDCNPSAGRSETHATVFFLSSSSWGEIENPPSSPRRGLMVPGGGHQLINHQPSLPMLFPMLVIIPHELSTIINH